MPVNENIIRLSKDITYQWITANKYIYQGYLSDDTMGSIGNAEIGHYAGMYHYDRNGIIYHRKTINVLKMVVEYINKHIYSELPELTTDNQNNADFLREILENNNFWKLNKQTTEKMLAMGDMLIKFWVEKNKVKINFVDADRFIVDDYDEKGNITGVSIITEYEEDGNNYIEFEKHYLGKMEDMTQDTYIIHTTTYKNKTTSTRSTAINRMGTVKGAFGEAISEEIIHTGSTIPMFTVIKTHLTNNKNLLSPRGLGAMTNHYGIIKSVNEVYDSLSNEITLGRKRIAINETMNQYVELASGEILSGFDRNEGVYEVFGSDGSTEIFKDLTSDLRIDPIILALKTQLETMSSSIGLTPGTWTVSDKGTITATQIISEKSETALFIKSVEQNLGQGWVKFLQNIMRFVKDLQPMLPIDPEAELEFQFYDNIIIDDEAERTFDIQLVESGLMPKVRFLMEWKGLTEDEAKQWIQEVEDENAFAFDLPEDEEIEDEI